LANHGYIPRNGKNISVWDLIAGLKAGYNLSTPLAWVLAFGGFLLLRRFTRISLYEIGRHGAVEHDASLVHHDTPAGSAYAPIEIDEPLVEDLIQDVRSTRKFIEGPNGGKNRMLMDAADVARARVRREKASPPLDGVHAEIARGEMAIALNMMRVPGEAGDGVPTEWMREWIRDERMPAGWTPTRVTGLLETVCKSKEIKLEMDRLRSEEARIAKQTQPKDTTPSKSHSRDSSATSTASSIFSNTAFSRESSPRTAVGDDEDEKEF